MSEKVSQFLKRTCLICGCHTNQTINIYEPRSGPNIVKLIQAKFKFQPLNDDKYLCFSCNNWLINWHSLQAMNSNDSEQSSDINSMVQERGEGPSPQQHQMILRPVAHIKPLNVLANRSKTKDISNNLESLKKQHFRRHIESQWEQKNNRLNRQKSLLRKKNAFSRKCIFGKKYTNCPSCDRVFVVIPLLSKNVTTNKCRKCRTVYQKENISNIQPLVIWENKLWKNMTHLGQRHMKKAKSEASTNFLKRPTIDGKVVAMLRRLGTSISRENDQDIAPPIMSPIKSKPIRIRQLENDEILLSFDNNLSEVLQNINKQTTSTFSTKAKRKLYFKLDAANQKRDLINIKLKI